MSNLLRTIPAFFNGASSYSHLAVEPLSKRELEVLRWLASGASNREISQLLYITEGTVKKHIYNIFGKLNVHNRTQATLQAQKLGVISSIEPDSNFGS